MKELFELRKFKNVREIDQFVPNTPGMYCLKLKDKSVLPKLFRDEIENRNHPFIYIGIASKSLRKRMLNQELRAKGHGTFFRSIGAALGYLPPFNSLKDKKNKRNYKFSDENEKAIISWINKNLQVNWIELNSGIDAIETQLIQKYQPVFNLDKNPKKFKELSTIRKKCVNYANGIEVNEK